MSRECRGRLNRAERTAGELAVSGYTGQSQGKSEVLLVSDLLTLPWYPADKLKKS